MTDKTQTNFLFLVKFKSRYKTTTRRHCDTIFEDAHPIGLQQHEDHTWRAVAPVHQQVPLVPDAWRVVPGREFKATHVVDAGLHQSVNVLLSANKAGLQGGAESIRYTSVFNILEYNTDDKQASMPLLAFQLLSHC